MKKDNKFTHFDNDGKAIMVDISDKNVTERLASAISSISMNEQTLNMIKSGNAKKGDVLGIARIAGIMAAKKTSELIPLCHPISLSSVTIDFEIDDNTNSINIRSCHDEIHHKTYLFVATDSEKESSIQMFDFHNQNLIKTFLTDLQN